MRCFRLIVAVVACLCAVVLFTLPGFAETSPYSKCSSLASPRIISRVDDNALMSLQGNLHPLARAQYDQGRVDDSLPLEHIILMLRRSPEQESALATRIDQMHNRRSPYYHQWLKAQDVGECYGVADSDIAVVTAWLESHGFKIDTVPAGKMLILFSGTAGQVRNTFHTEIHNLYVRGEQHIANMSEPQIPAALAPVITGFHSLHNFFSKPAIRSIGTVKRDQKTGTWQPLEAGDRFLGKKAQPNGQGGNPDFTFGSGGNTYYAVGPQDLYTIYDETPLLTATTPINGAGQTLAVIERTTITQSDVATFRTAFGLPTYPTTPNATRGGVNFMDGITGYCTNPGVSSDDVGEASLDVEWIGVTAPAATIDFVSCAASNTTDGIDLSLIYAITTLADTVSAISSSYGGCEPSGGSALEADYSTLFEQAVAEGQTVVVAAGDSGSDACDRGDADGPNSGQDLGETGASVQTQSSTQYAVAAGGTDFSDAYQGNISTYWHATNGTGLSSAISYIPEMAWNETCSDTLILDFVGYDLGITYPSGALGLCNDDTNSATFGENYPFTTIGGGTGGVSEYTALPTWQSVYGVGLNGNFTSTTHRNLPDVSMYAAIATPWPHFLLFCVSSVGPCDYSNGNDAFAQGVGGTSAVAPMLSGIIALINQANPSGNGQPTRQGQADYTFYALAGAEYGAPGSPNTSTSAPSLYTCEGSNINAINTYGSVFQTCNFNNVARTSQHGSTSCLGATNTGCLVDNNGGACAAGTPDCYTGTTGDTYGILSLSKTTFESAYNQSAGYNAATGLGSVNIANLVANWMISPLPFASTTTLSLSPSSLYTTTTADLTATVTATGRGGIAPPMGTVSFYAGTACTGTAFASANLVPASNCTTSCNATASASGVTGAQIGAGTTTVAACFSGDGANDATSSTTASVTVTQTALTVSAPATPVTIVGGQSGTVTLTVSANTAISTPVTFTCAGLPSDATCTFTSVNSLPSSTSVTMTIHTTAADAKLIRPARGSSWLMLGFVLPGILLLPAVAAAIRRGKSPLWCGLVLLLMLGWLGCGGGGSSSTPTPTPTPTPTSQTYSVTATGSATGATSGTTGTISVTVN
jgi:subtilase family serine protease